ncbi:hypothetical protein KDK95_09995 [Actinospica sp. MGRD01-02]|uniref:Uncharacterized protein n=1 Tax=Actinospica acidithermotolerans TaxID=2828514 RepID=A0A941E7U9_9ACTN|nr:hypothetical protein [Actinospica acidithermotolerans]MBR7826636.1 hypothetical protein [Actinospica acidithermotolerans]
MPFLVQVMISGTGLNERESSRSMEAIAAAIAEGWESRWSTFFDADDADGHAQADGPEEAERVVLDEQIVGRPGSVDVQVVLGGPGLGLEEAALSATGLARHLTGWSPELLACTIASVQVSEVDQPYDENNWLKPLEVEEDLAARFSLTDLMDSPLHELAAGYLLAGGVRSLWEPGRRVNGSVLEARDVVLGAVEHPWGRELTAVLGRLLVQAARLEAASGERARLTMTAGGHRELAAALLGRVRAGVEDEEEWGDEDDALDSDDLRGHVLLEQFMEDFGLAWNRVPDDLPRPLADERCDRQLRELLWAGMNVLAALCASQKAVTNPWQLLAALDQDTVVEELAQRETARVAEWADAENEELREGCYSLAAVWLAVRAPEALRTSRGAAVVDVAAGSGAFLGLINASLLELGPGPVGAALEQLDVPATVAMPMAAFVRALEATCLPQDAEGDPYDEMGHALDAALARDAHEAGRVLALTQILHRAAALSATDANPRRDSEGYISSPEELSAELLTNAKMHAGVIQGRETDESVLLSLGALALVAWVEPTLAGALARELPDLSGSDPLIEPAARLRAMRWVTDALAVVGVHADELAIPGGGDTAAEAADLRAVLSTSGRDAGLLADWPVARLVSAAAGVTAAALSGLSAGPDAAFEVFLGSGFGAGPST